MALRLVEAKERERMAQELCQSQQQQQTRVNVTVLPDGTLALNKNIIPIDQLESNVRSLMIATQQTVVIINADKAVEHGKVVDVLDQVKKIDGEHREQAMINVICSYDGKVSSDASFADLVAGLVQVYK